MIIRRTFLAAVAGALATYPAAAADAPAPPLPPAPAPGSELAVASQGGALQTAQHEAYFRPFTTATGTAVKLTSWSGSLDELHRNIETGALPWDVVLVDPADLGPGCDAGLFEKLDWSALGGKDHFLPLAVSDCGVGTAVSSLALTWDRDKFQATPTWSDFWDVARYPGKRGLRRSAQTTLEIALLADAVAPGDVYRTLRSDDGVERAFHKLEQLKPYLAWWMPDTGASQILKSGEVLLTSAQNVPVALANRAGGHFGLQWAGCLYAVQSWAVVKGSPNLVTALKLLAFASDPARQAALTAALPYGPTVKGANEALAPDIQAYSPTAAANLAGALQIDEGYWHDNGAKLEQRFQTWLAHS